MDTRARAYISLTDGVVLSDRRSFHCRVYRGNGVVTKECGVLTRQLLPV